MIEKNIPYKLKTQNRRDQLFFKLISKRVTRILYYVDPVLSFLFSNFHFLISRYYFLISKRSPKHTFSLIFCFLISVFYLQGQNVSINPTGASPDPSAMLDVSSTTQGLLIPRMTKIQRDAITSPAQGLMIFMTTDTVGFFYYDSNWKYIGGSSSSLQIDSSRIADADGNTKIQVEETTNDDIIRFDIGGTEHWTMEGARFVSKNTGNSIFIGDSAGVNDDFTDNNNIAIGVNANKQTTAGTDNIAIGVGANEGNTTGNFNIAIGTNAGLIQGIPSTSNNILIGREALRSTNSSNNNVVIGNLALRQNSSGNLNVVVGHSSLSILASGNSNTAIGQSAGNQITSGSHNSLLGTSAMAGKFSADSNVVIGSQAASSTNALFNSVIIGTGAGKNASGRSKLYIENSNSNTPLVYGDFANDSLKIYGLFSIDSAKDGSGYTFPGRDGSANQFLQTDGNGQLSWQALAGGDTLSIIQDADNDTKIQVEESTDEDLIRFDVAGTERFVMYPTRIEQVNSGFSTYIGENAGQNDNLTDNANTAIGYNAYATNGSGSNNVAIGRNAMANGALGNNNVAIGQSTLFNTTSNENMAIGNFALQQQTIGNENLAIGNEAMQNATTGQHNTVIGYQAMETPGASGNNTVVGFQALQGNFGTDNVIMGYRAANNYNLSNRSVVIGAAAGGGAGSRSNNTMIGYSAGSAHTGSNSTFIGALANFGSSSRDDILVIDNASSTTPLIFGDFANDSVKINGTLSVGDAFTFPTTDGTNGQVLQTDGSGLVSWASVSGGGDTLSLIQDADRDTRVEVEETTDDDKIKFKIQGTEYFRMDTGRLSFLNTGFSVLIGEDAGRLDDYTNNDGVFIGRRAGYNQTSGLGNVAIGGSALYLNTNQGFLTAIGYQALQNNTGFGNTAVGASALTSNSTGNRNTALGQAASNSGSTGSDNTNLGYSAGNRNNTGNSNVSVGSQADNFNQGGSNNVMIGRYAGYVGSLHSKSGNIFIGFSSGFNETGSNKLYIENSNSSTPLIYGDFANDSLKVYGTLSVGDAFTFPTTDGTSGQILQTDGNGSVSWATASADTAQLIADGDGDTRVSTASTTNNIDFVQRDTVFQRFNRGALEFVNTGSSVFIGENAGAADDLSANSNTFIGNSAGAAVTQGALNTALGARAMEASTNANDNVAIGFQALSNNIIGGENVAIGNLALFSSTSGKNTAIGLGASQRNTTGNNNVSIGYQSNGFNQQGSFNTIIGVEAGEAGAIHNKSGNVLIGYRAGYSNTTSNRFYLHNDSSLHNSLMYGEFDNQLLRINGELQIGNPAGAGIAYRFPTLDGTANEVLFTDGAGQLGYGRIRDLYGEASLNDTLGFHLMNTNLVTDGNWISGDGDTEGIFINNNGNVGIGNSVPGARLSVTDQLWLTQLSGSGLAFTSSNTIASGFGQILYDADVVGVGQPSMDINFKPRNNINSGTGHLGNIKFQKYANANKSYMAFSVYRNSLTEVMRIDSSTRVGIGITSPLGKLHVDNGGGAVAVMTSSSDAEIGYVTGTDFEIVGVNGTTGAIEERNFIMSGGNVGIGTTTPTEKLEVNGRLKTNGIQELSDARYKTNIETLTNALEKLTQLRGVSYEWDTAGFPEKNFNTRKQIGLIAQELEPIFPELVHTDAEGYKSVDYSKLVAVLIEAMKQQQNEIVRLRTTQQEQHKTLDELKASVNFLLNESNKKNLGVE